MLHVKNPIGLANNPDGATLRKINNLGRRRLRKAIRQYALASFGSHDKTARYSVDVCTINGKLHIALDIFGNTGIRV